MQRLPREHLIHTVSFLDAAGGRENKQKNKARSAIVTISADAANRIFVRHAWAERCSTEKLYDKIYEINDQFKPHIFGIEGNAQQTLFVDSVIKDAFEKKINIPIQCVIQPTSINKDFRIRTYLQPVVSTGRLFFQKSQINLLEEVLDFPMSTIKDLIDALASAVFILPKQVPLDSINEESEAHLEYLRNSGAPPSYIEQVAAGYSREDTQVETIDQYLELVRGRN